MRDILLFSNFTIKAHLKVFWNFLSSQIDYRRTRKPDRDRRRERLMVPGYMALSLCLLR